MYEVEKVVGSRINKFTKKPEYLVKWEGYDSKQNTWEPQENLTQCKQLIMEFNRSNSRGKAVPSVPLTKTKSKESKHSHSFGEESEESRNDESQEDKQFNEDSGQQLDEDYSNKFSGGKSKLIKKNPYNKLKKLNLDSSVSERKKKGESEEKGLKILGFGYKKCFGKEKKYYKVTIGSETKWVQKSFIMPEHAVQYCEFLEKNITFKDR